MYELGLFLILLTAGYIFGHLAERRHYRSIIRREAVLRMQDQARHKGAKSIFHVKFETASISKGTKGTVGSVEVLAFGAAVIPKGCSTD